MPEPVSSTLSTLGSALGLFGGGSSSSSASIASDEGDFNVSFGDGGGLPGVPSIGPLDLALSVALGVVAWLAFRKGRK